MVQDRTCGWAGCKFVTVDLHAFQTHLFQHAREIPQRCQWKGCKTAAYSAVLENYWHLLRAHTGIREYFCGHCDKQFHSPVLLKLHERKVHGQRKKDIFDCAYLDCAYTSLTGVLMKQHLAYVHSNPYVFESILQTRAIRTLLPNSANPQRRVLQEFEALVNLKIKQEPDEEEEILLSSDEEDVVMTSAECLNGSKCVARPVKQPSDIIHDTSGAPSKTGQAGVQLNLGCVEKDGLDVNNIKGDRKSNCLAYDTPGTSGFQNSSSGPMGNINLDKKEEKSTVAEDIDLRPHAEWTNRAGIGNRSVQYHDIDLRPASEINNNVNLEVNLVRPAERIDVNVYINPDRPSPSIIQHEESCILNRNEQKSAENPVSNEPSAPVRETPVKRKRGRPKKEESEEKKARLAAGKKAADEVKKAAEEEREVERKKEAEKQKEMENKRKKHEKTVAKSNHKPIPTAPFAYKKADLTQRIPKIKAGSAAINNHDFRSPLAAKQSRPPPQNQLHIDEFGSNRQSPSTFSPSSESSLKENSDRTENRPRIEQKRSFDRPKRPIFKPKRNAPCPNGGVMDLLDQQLGDWNDREAEKEGENAFSNSSPSMEASTSLNAASFSKSAASMAWELPPAISPPSTFSSPVSSPPHPERRREELRSLEDDFGRDDERRPPEKRSRWDRKPSKVRSKSPENPKRTRTPENRRLEPSTHRILRFDGAGNRLATPKPLKGSELRKPGRETAENANSFKNKDAERPGTSREPPSPPSNPFVRALWATPSCNLPPPDLFPTTIVTHLLPPAPGFPPGFFPPIAPQYSLPPLEIIEEPLTIPPPPPPLTPPTVEKGAESGGRERKGAESGGNEQKGAEPGGKDAKSDENRCSPPPKQPNTERLAKYRLIRVATDKRSYKMNWKEYGRHLQRRPPSRPFLPNIPIKVNPTLKDPRRPHGRF
ncbi:unnamed protein product [Bursaphelenchus xylophilus]|uniref:(pine wood nematode) hypothetical protein n=1 Tax=Bursaphelenchus xylophilus TaxID=6326 RepID=A0A1I7SA60_BURXY|nr:unnamed protein product [Bursaphelenchus xylophilus]CAG9131843.1 unnamed protein product [Bursaphelenchus xylophilus]